MTSSDKFTMADWQVDTLVSRKPPKTPGFVRSSWDEGKGSDFGPWRLVPKIDPTEGLSRHGADVANVEVSEEASALSPTTEQDVNEAAAVSSPSGTASVLVEPPAPHLVGISEQELEQTRAQAYEQGVAAGLVQARDQWEAERHQEKELLRHLGIELRALNQDSQRFHEPLRKLALHVAEQLVRAELQVNGQVVDRLIGQCVQILEQPGAKVVVSLNPQDLKRLQALGDDATQHYQLEPDPTLREGSVRVRVNDTAVQDLIEHRLDALAGRLLSDPSAWPAKSVLLRPATADDLAADMDRPGLMARPDRPWSRTKMDVQDVQEVQPRPASRGPASDIEDA